MSSRNIIVPNEYRGISFQEWLSIFLNYALCLAKYNRANESYEVCGAAKDAIIYFHSRDSMFLIYACWCSKRSSEYPILYFSSHILSIGCALLACDDETCVTVSRWFMKEYQFTTDSYRLYAALCRACQTSSSSYKSGPSQKFIMRQIKTRILGW